MPATINVSNNSSCNIVVDPTLVACNNKTTAATATTNTTTVMEPIATDSGRESVNEFDSSLDDSHLSKKPCTSEFYASSGSQTKWYLKPEEMISHNDANKEDAASGEQQTQCQSSMLSNYAANTHEQSSCLTSNKCGSPTVLALKLRATSSPALNDIAEDSFKPSATTNATLIKLPDSTTDANGVGVVVSVKCNRNNNNVDGVAGNSASQSVGVLQKFKRTLSNFNNKHQQQQQQQQTTISKSGQSSTCPSTLNLAAAAIGEDQAAGNDNSDNTTSKYRFGPLIWRTSKERRKAKNNRRDKCNSGDSGIQIELENDETLKGILPIEGNNNSQANNVNAKNNKRQDDEHKQRLLRRTYSAKAATLFDQTTAALNAKARIFRKIENFEREVPESLPTRSISQPYGLETCGIERTDTDESDTDSVASNDDGPNYYPIYAEVLYNFHAAGPQELGLERGTLIEILRKEAGPWWFGRIKKEDASLVEEILDPELGWFPKEFVRIIQYPESDAFFLSHVSQINQTHLPLSPSIMVVSSSTAPERTPEDADKTLVANAAGTMDHNNVTTIIIEPPPTVVECNTNTENIDNNAVVANGSALVSLQNDNIIVDNADIVHCSAIKELLDAETTYVKLLDAICDCYLPAMSQRIDIFPPNSIRMIFSNITTICKFQHKFLDALRKGIEQHQVAKVFLQMYKGFLCYSSYCNGYPRALMELESYNRVRDANIIFENCRETENLVELPLSAHLLAPVQRICRYPLHLNEIVKTAKSCTNSSTLTKDMLDKTLDISKMDIPDTRENFDLALEAMKSIAEAVNEGKRHSEAIARYQSSFQNFKGPPLYMHSTRFFLQMEVTRQKQNIWNSSCTLFVFDNQLIYCKRDIIKRSQFIYKGRIFLDRCRVVNVRDGKMFGHTIKNSLRIYCESRDKWYDFIFRSANRKHHFLNTLALERQFGGNPFYISEMTGYEYTFEDRDYSDQSDYELVESENRLRTDLSLDRANSAETAVDESTTTKSALRYSDTLPKKSQAVRNSTITGTEDCNAGSLGRRRLGNWFCRPKSSTSTPNHSPTHKPLLQKFSGSDNALLQLTTNESHETVVEQTHHVNSGSNC